MALQVVSIPAISSSRSDSPNGRLSGRPSISASSRHDVRSSRGSSTCRRSARRSSGRTRRSSPRGPPGYVDALEDVVDELAEHVVVLHREAEHAGDHVDRDVLGVLQGGVDDGLAGRRFAHVVEALPAQHADLRLPGSICFGVNGGSRSRRARAWNGGSLVIGGAPPIGAWAVIVDVLTTTARLVKWSCRRRPRGRARR